MAPSFKPFHLMTAENYAAIGLRCGLEVHRQLLTRTKLFCRCPAGQYRNEYDAEILRHMRPTLSELGEYDGTALMEKKTRKNIYYRVHRDTVCTYEFDDTPPFFLAEDALDAAIELALLLRLNRVSELHIARKQYLDGSIPAGFQRTTILGVDGWIPYKGRRIGIRQLGLEEDACREVSDDGHDRVFLTDRLGTPLVEVVTEAEMKTPEETAEVASIIRRLCRSTGKVRTGYGTARQDVNVSVTGGTRIEIKGVPQIGRIPRQVYNEARRQCSLLRIRNELNRRGVTPDSFRCRAGDITRIVARTHYQPIRSAIERGLHVRCAVLERFAGLLSEATQEHTTFAKEFSDRVRVIACLTSLPNMVHSDTGSESLYGRDWLKLRKRMKAAHDDAIILVWGDEADVRTACDEIAIRAREATRGVPSDTRQALKDGTNGFERVLPGAQRMYPDTDLPPMSIPDERVDRIQRRLPEFVWDREARYRKLGLSETLIEPLMFSPRIDLFDRIVGSLGVDPKFVVVVLCQVLKSFRRKGLEPHRLTDAEILEVFELFAGGGLAREGVARVLGWMLRQRLQDSDRTVCVAQAVEALGFSPCTSAKTRAEIRRVAAKLNGRSFATQGARQRFCMGVLMGKLSGRTPGTDVAGQVAGLIAGLPDRGTSLNVEA